MGKMRQLLSRKSHQKMSDDENRSSRPNGFSSQTELTGERVFPIRSQRESGELLGLFPNVKTDGPVSTNFEFGKVGVLYLIATHRKPTANEFNSQIFRIWQTSQASQISVILLNLPRPLWRVIVTSIERLQRGHNTSPIHMPYLRRLSQGQSETIPNLRTVDVKTSRFIYREPSKASVL